MSGRKPRAKKPVSKDDTIRIRVSTAERVELEAAAAADDLKLSTWMRRLALRQARGSAGK